ncbi:MAG: hypothetical protein ABEJ65_11730, partial [bacterium]
MKSMNKLARVLSLDRFSRGWQVLRKMTFWWDWLFVRFLPAMNLIPEHRKNEIKQKYSDSNKKLD